MPPTATSGNTIWGANNQWQPNIYSFPNGSDPGWQITAPFGGDIRGMAFGWWITSLSINRLIIGAASVNVTVGCIRNRRIRSPFGNL